jgi:hypothetical protein
MHGQKNGKGEGAAPRAGPGCVPGGGRSGAESDRGARGRAPPARGRVHPAPAPYHCVALRRPGPIVAGAGGGPEAHQRAVRGPGRRPREGPLRQGDRPLCVRAKSVPARPSRPPVRPSKGLLQRRHAGRACARVAPRPRPPGVCRSAGAASGRGPLGPAGCKGVFRLAGAAPARAGRRHAPRGGRPLEAPIQGMVAPSSAAAPAAGGSPGRQRAADAGTAALCAAAAGRRAGGAVPRRPAPGRPARRPIRLGGAAARRRRHSSRRVRAAAQMHRCRSVIKRVPRAAAGSGRRRRGGPASAGAAATALGGGRPAGPQLWAARAAGARGGFGARVWCGGGAPDFDSGARRAAPGAGAVGGQPAPGAARGQGLDSAGRWLTGAAPGPSGHHDRHRERASLRARPRRHPWEGRGGRRAHACARWPAGVAGGPLPAGAGRCAPGAARGRPAGGEGAEQGGGAGRAWPREGAPSRGGAARQGAAPRVAAPPRTRSVRPRDRRTSAVAVRFKVLQQPAARSASWRGCRAGAGAGRSVRRASGRLAAGAGVLEAPGTGGPPAGAGAVRGAGPDPELCVSGSGSRRAGRPRAPASALRVCRRATSALGGGAAAASGGAGAGAAPCPGAQSARAAAVPRSPPPPSLPTPSYHVGGAATPETMRPKLPWPEGGVLDTA